MLQAITGLLAGAQADAALGLSVYPSGAAGSQGGGGSQGHGAAGPRAAGVHASAQAGAGGGAAAQMGSLFTVVDVDKRTGV